MNESHLDMLYTLAKELNTSEDIPTMLDAVITHLPRVVGARYCSLFLRNPSSGELEIKAHNHTDIGEDPFIHVGSQQESIMNLVLARNASLIIRDIEEEIGIQNKDKYTTKSFMCILVRHADEIKGVLNLADKANGGFTKEDMLISSIVSELLAALLARIDLNTV
ncbi:MAG: GAF domain-containing protein [Desulfomonilia bacterium]|nr:GAF domain-containing protein [Pseudomonadota bacterium]HPD22589.1 GAF domain-containing protein [Deltaproteobacteria bacterium]HPW69606.1 GAF domain-containing protein [Deltaproteobacteria bacterium]HRS57383.1 GAF domain-containing protein [Desulfomonilia bacterium]HRV36919.1 GAF domain-containing protein [Desulfomonilia bacterium]